jgi:hypothetical protein
MLYVALKLRRCDMAADCISHLLLTCRMKLILNLFAQT